MGNPREMPMTMRDGMQRGIVAASREGWSSEAGSVASGTGRLESRGEKEGEQNQKGPCKRKNELGLPALLGFECVETVE